MSKNFPPCFGASVKLRIVFGIFFWDQTGDDSFIFYRYAQNFVDGHGLLWNVHDEPVEGFSSPLWVLWLGVFGQWFNMTDIARWSNVLCLMLVWVLIWKQSKKSIAIC